MKKQPKIEYWQLESGYELPPANCKIEPSMVASYIKAVQESDSLYQDSKLVPPMAVATYAMASFLEAISFPPGVIHTHGEIEFLDTVSSGDTIKCYSRVSQKQDRGQFHLLTIDFSVFNQEPKQVLTGKSSFILPELDNES